MIALLLQNVSKISSGYFLMLIPKVSQAKCYRFLIIPPPIPPPRIFQSANMIFIATWDAFETSGWMA